MGATRPAPGFLRPFLLLLLLLLLLLSSSVHLSSPTCAGLQPRGAQQPGRHRPLTDEQEADQNLRFMMNLYRSAAEPDGRPKQHRKFGSNTVRLLKPSASSVRYLPASTDHRYCFTVQYHLDTLPTEQLVRVSFVHLRSSSLNATGGAATPTPTPPPPRCSAQIASLGKESLVTLEPHQQWTETDITAHVRQGQDRSPRFLTLTAQYWCTEPGRPEERRRRRWRRWWTRLRERAWGGGGEEGGAGHHVQVPSLLLYLEEEREGKDWMGDLLGSGGGDVLRQVGLWHSSRRRRRRRRSNEISASEQKDPPLDTLKNAPTSPSSFSTSPSDSVIANLPGYKRGAAAAPKNRCRLHSFRLSFDELGWGHYFIAPPVYNPRFCQGNCPRVLHYGYHSPNHAIIQTVINDLGVGDVPPPSCVPYKYMPMSVLVVHKKKVEYRELEDMVAESCTCR